MSSDGSFGGAAAACPQQKQPRCETTSSLSSQFPTQLWDSLEACRMKSMNSGSFDGGEAVVGPVESSRAAAAAAHPQQKQKRHKMASAVLGENNLVGNQQAVWGRQQKQQRGAVFVWQKKQQREGVFVPSFRARQWEQQRRQQKQQREAVVVPSSRARQWDQQRRQQKQQREGVFVPSFRARQWEQQRRQQKQQREAVVVPQRRQSLAELFGQQQQQLPTRPFPLLLRKQEAERAELRARQEAEILELRAQASRDAAIAIRARLEAENTEMRPAQPIRESVQKRQDDLSEEVISKHPKSRAPPSLVEKGQFVAVLRRLKKSFSSRWHFQRPSLVCTVCHDDLHDEGKIADTSITTTASNSG